MTKCLVFEKIKIVLVWFANFIISLSLIEPEGCITADTPELTKVSKPSTNGKKASDAAIILLLFSKEWNCLILLIAILQLSNLLGCPDPIPIVVPLFAKTIALDLTYLHTLNANIRFFNVLESGFFFDTILKFEFEKVKLSDVWNK